MTQQVGKLIAETAKQYPDENDATKLAAAVLVNTDGVDLKDCYQQLLEKACADFLRNRRNSAMNAVFTGIKAGESTGAAATATATGTTKAAKPAAHKGTPQQATNRDGSVRKPVPVSAKLKANWDTMRNDKIPSAPGKLKRMGDCSRDELAYSIKVASEHIDACVANRDKRQKILTAMISHNVDTVDDVQLSWLAT